VTVNGWMGLAFDLRRSRGLDHGLPELGQLRRAVQIATRAGPGPAASGGASDLRRTTVEAQQAILLHAVRTGQVALVRRSGRLLRVGDFAGERSAVEGMLAVLRDARTPDADLLEAAAHLAALAPAGS
jgi:hypothetical protein